MHGVFTRSLIALTTIGAAVKVRMRGLARRFLVHGRAVDALAGIDLDVDAGECLCIVGSSGCGKTTLLRIWKESTKIVFSFS